METEAAICWGAVTDWIVEPIELDPPKSGEVLVKLAASGMCHSDEHIVTGDLGGGNYPIVGGHEGAGVVEEVGPGGEWLPRLVTTWCSGSFPRAGSARHAHRAVSSLCDNGALLMTGMQVDGTTRIHARGQDIKVMCCLGTFGKYAVVNQMSCVKILPDLPSGPGVSRRLRRYHGLGIGPIRRRRAAWR